MITLLGMGKGGGGKGMGLQSGQYVVLFATTTPKGYLGWEHELPWLPKMEILHRIPKAKDGNFTQDT